MGDRGLLRRSPLLRCLAVYGEMPGRFLLTAVLLAAVNIALVGQQVLVGHAVQEAQHGKLVIAGSGGLDYSRAWLWVMLLLGLSLARATVQYGAGLLSLSIGQRLLTILRGRILTQIQRLDLAYHWRHGVGEMVTRMTRDADKVRDALINFWRQIFETGLIVVISLGLLFLYSPWLALVPAILLSIGIALLWSEADTLVALDRRIGDAYDAVTQDLSEGVNGVRVIKAFSLGEARADRFRHHVDLFRAEARAAIRHASRRVPLPQTIIALSHAWVLGFGAWMVAHGTLGLGAVVAAMLVVNTLVLRIEGIGRLLQVIADARASAARIWEVLDAHPVIRSGAQPLPTGPLGIRLRNLSASPLGHGATVLRDLSLSVQPGEIVALVGATGSGKSILTALLPRLVEVDKGAVEVGSDQAGWQDVRETDLRELRRRVHVLPQESFLFSDTLAANLRLCAPHATEAQLREALDNAAAGELLERLSEGLDTRVGDRGATLSGGQRQRVCLARALLADADILVLDDATSALDARTERRAIDNIRALRSGRTRPLTMLIVASRLSTALIADRVAVLGEGRIIAQGSPEHLANNSASYRALMGL
ncbi:ABC transporter ATP-binding protein [Sphingomonadales bacterium 56]|nr:ABC transporter ATP-binding protein [Sphingomonadales bacterium 56]MBY2959195.1 ABC transporter ATP-binding protein [Sphingomonadales bacterium 58]CAD7338293.1 Putative multidrug export ATP-binding/permease protein [Sphingobium sp. S6]CAD7338676.1 Putative multidrug export ATP-binding/permease protein [Sphingobium sp. S8]